MLGRRTDRRRSGEGRNVRSNDEGTMRAVIRAGVSVCTVRPFRPGRFAARRRSVLSALLCVSAYLCVSVRADPEQFRGGTELVSVYATVQGQDGRLVPDLRQEDFIVTDNGRPQPITFFSSERSPFSVVLLLDRSMSMEPHKDVVNQAAAVFVKQMLPADRARIGFIANRMTIAPSEFTASHDALIDVLRQPVGGGASPIWFSVDQSITALYGVEGRRVILLMSDGDDQPYDGFPRTDYKGLLDRIRRSGVMIYAIGFTVAELRDGRTETTKPNEKLRQIADVSGGGYFAMRTTADLSGLFTQVADELHQQYWLGFAPPKRDGKLHEIEVKVKRPGLVARARRSYLAPSGQ